jgi:exopolysaccharide biosynthesis polyprenyl glycosylphosphotransferase
VVAVSSIVGGAALAFALSLADLHDVRVALLDAQRGARVLASVGALCCAGAAVALAFALAAGPGARRSAASAIASGLPAAGLLALALRSALPSLDRRMALRTRLFLVGEGRAAHRLIREIQRDGTVEIVGFCGPRAESIARKARQAGADSIVVATDDRHGPDDQELLRCRIEGMEVCEAPLFAARALHRLPVELVRPIDLVYGDGFTAPAWERVARRALSIAVALLLLAATAPVLLVAAIAIRLDTPGPVLFRQRRVGRAGRTFEMLKLRTMRADAERTGAAWARTNDPRVTRVGRWLRRFRVDELPQLVNVLRGDMELVGPRPERPEFVADLRLKIPFYDLRHLVPPGITGWAQVSYPYAASVEEAKEKLQYDLYYVRHVGLAFDLFVLMLTARTVLQGRGAR